jgi:hypothetical protein
MVYWILGNNNGLWVLSLKTKLVFECVCVCVCFWGGGGGGGILCYSQSGNDTQEDLARFGYNLNMKVIFKKHPSILLVTYLNRA